MKKLQKGDYVTDLTECQFNDLVGISNQKVFTWSVSILKTDGYISKSVLYDTKLLHTENKRKINKLTFEEFKQRAINTFKEKQAI